MPIEGKNKSRETFLIVGMYACIWLVFSFIYVEYVSDIFNYDGYDAIWTFNSVLISFFLFVALVLMASRINPEKFSYLFFHLMLLLSVLPLSVLCAFAGKSIIYLLQVMVAISVLFLTLKLPLHFGVPKFGLSDKIILSIFLTASLILLLVYYCYNGFDSFNLDFFKVYQFRSAAAENLPDSMSYISSLISKIVLPMCGVLFIKVKNKIGLILVILLTMLFFGFTSHKSALFSVFLLMGLYYLMRYDKKLIKILMMYLAGIALSAVAFNLYLLFENDYALMLGSVLFRRALILPSELNYVYFVYFSDGDFVYWADSKLSLGFVDFYYDKSIPEIIGDFRFPGAGSSANTGWLGNGYAHAGIIGMIIYSFVIAIFLKYADNVVSKTKDEKLAMAVLIMPSLVLITSSDLPTTFLTHGLIFSLIIVLLMQKKNL